MLRVVHYIRATNMNISTDLYFRISLKLFKNLALESNKSINCNCIKFRVIKIKTFIQVFYLYSKFCCIFN